jgi:glycosyltransferase involved in cell wall biosynthesis
MAAQCPVTSAQTTSLPEVAGEAALFFDPTRAEAIAGAVDRLWNDSELRERLRRAGAAQARRWTWQRTALQTLKLYRRMIEQLRSASLEDNAA